jgi:hypothetical protein
MATLNVSHLIADSVWPGRASSTIRVLWFWGHDRQEVTDLAEPVRGQYSFLKAK